MDVDMFRWICMDEGVMPTYNNPDDEESELVYGFPELYRNPQKSKCIQSCLECTTNLMDLNGLQWRRMDSNEKLNLPLWIVNDVAK